LAQFAHGGILLHINVLGSFEVAGADQPKPMVIASRLQSLLAHLLLRRGVPQMRGHLCTVFWPEEPEAKARNNLRQMLHQLRQALPEVDRYLHTNAQQITWCVDATQTSDVAEFETAIARAKLAGERGDDQASRKHCQMALGLYRGELLPNCYDDWIAPERERLQREMLHTLKQLVALLECANDLVAAISHAQRLHQIDPLDEEAAERLMRLHALNHDRASALRAYQSHTTALRTELGIEPSQALQENAQRLTHAADDAQAELARQRQDMTPPLIGRQAEWVALQAAWRKAARGHMHLAVVSGEAGIGKTRLAEELLNWVQPQGIAAARTRAYAAEGGLAYAPVTDWLRSPAMQAQVRRLDAVWLSELTRIVPELLSERPDLSPPAAMSDPAQRQRFYEAMARAVLSASQPLLLLMDDLQWCSQEMLEWLRYLLRFQPAAKVLIVGTLRVEEIDTKHPLTRLLLDLRNANQLTEIDLKRLDAAESAHLAQHVLRREMATNEATQLYRDTEGNPLFVVEMARAGLGQAVTDGVEATLRLPPRVHAVITARLAQLSEAALAVMHLGATIGRVFGLDVLTHASQLDEEQVLQGLDELWQRRIVRAQTGHTYDFTHDKLREVAYAQLGPAKQRLLHRRTAQAIQAVFAHDLDAVSAQLAVQYERAGLIERATVFYQRAGSLALSLYASTEAIGLFNKGLGLLCTLPQSTVRDELELDMLTQLNAAFGTGNSFQTLDQFDLLFQIQTISKRLGRSPSSRVLRSLATNYIVRTKFPEALQVGTQLLQLAHKSNDPSILVDAHEALGITNFWTGEFDAAHKNFEAAIKCFADPSWDHKSMLYSWDSAAVCRCRQALNLWCLGFPDQALGRQAESIDQAQSTQHPFTCAYTLTWGGWLSLFLRDPGGTVTYSNASLKLSAKHGLLWWSHWGLVLHGWAIASQGDRVAGIPEIEQGIEGIISMKSQLNVVFLRTLILEHHLVMGQTDRALIELESLIELAEQRGERWYLSEICRMHGDALTIQKNAESEAQNMYQRAIAIAQQQNAKSFELRAATSLARLWQSQGKTTEARDLLAPIYGWFTEGFDTADLKAAKALLTELSGS
jgi:DNA-binding SARP family transcriptional activator/tetratricopeptide (TPR) repeat protein